MIAICWVLFSFLSVIAHASETDSELQSLAERAALSVGAGLKKNLLEAKEKKGPAGAIEFCSEKALGLTKELAHVDSRVLGVKRTSHKFRNPANAPTEDEEAALTELEQLAVAGKPLPPFLWKKDPAKSVAHYYKSIKVEALCLTCHGPSEGIPAPVKKVLQSKYPNDLATGYKEGNFRGVFHVTVSTAN